MQACWRLGPATVREILNETLNNRVRDYRTIQTFLIRMERKGWLRVEKEGNRNVYAPAVSSSVAITHEIEAFLQRIANSDDDALDLVAEAVSSWRRRSPPAKRQRKHAVRTR